MLRRSTAIQGVCVSEAYVCGSCAEISKIVAQGIRMGMEAQRGAGEVRHEQEK